MQKVSLRETAGVRFAGDNPELYGLKPGEHPDGSETKRKLLTRAVKVIPELFPSLSPVLNRIEEVVPDVPFEVFVFSEASPQAFCTGDSSRESTILVSSGLIERFSPAELTFVLGHEMGHALFAHTSYPDPSKVEGTLDKLKVLALWRSREITADRVGLAATGDASAAFRAMMKLASGLSDQYIRFDVTAFLDQMKDLEEAGPSVSFLLSTHPFITVRIKAMLWFQMSEPWYRVRGKRGTPSLNIPQLENKVLRELRSGLTASS